MLLANCVGAFWMVSTGHSMPLDFFRTLSRYVMYGSIAAAFLTVVAAWPLLRYLDRLHIPTVPQCIIFFIAGSALAVPFAIVGLIVDGNASLAWFGAATGAWCGVIGRALYVVTSASRVVVIVTWATVGVLCLAGAVLSSGAIPYP
jgi:hypothetical protein